jgi:predicted aspartyl protease
MYRIAMIGVAVAVTAGSALGYQAAGRDVELLYRTHQWFELRSSVTSQSPALIRATVAAAFNDPERAESLLRSIIRSQPRSEMANEAYDLIAKMEVRSGQYARFNRTYAEWSAAFPNSPGVRAAKNDLDKFRGRPDQANGPRRRSTLHHERGSYSVPVTINGKTDEFVIDTGAGQSVLTDREAKKFGLTILTGSAPSMDSSGTGFSSRTAIAREVIIGAMRFRSVSFEVLPADGPFGDAEGGIVGLPIQLALGSIRWLKDGIVEIGAATPPSGSSPNLVFDSDPSRLLIGAEVLGKRVQATLDTGATTTDLNANFADLFPDVLSRDGKRGRQDITGAGGTQTFDSFELPQLTFAVGQSRPLLRPGIVTLQRMPLMGGGYCCIGNAGLDLLTQGLGFSIDFATMTLQIQ